jgi:iron complex transport system substrate-binding protein
MTKWWLLLILLVGWIALGFVLFGPHQAAASAEGPHSSTPVRIVSMAPNLTEILFALGLGEQVVGVTQDGDYPPAAATKPKVGTFWQPNVEAVIATRPNLVLTLTFQQQRDLANRLARMGFRCLSLDIWSVDDLFEAIAATGEATGRTDKSSRLVADIHNDIQKLQALMAGKEKKKVLWVVQREPLRVAGRDTFVNELIELAGGENAIGPTVYKYPPIGGEQVLACGVEVIIEPAMVGDDIEAQRVQAIAHWQRLASVPAVAENRIYVIDGDTVSRLGPRVYEGIETIARCLHPDVFGE